MIQYKVGRYNPSDSMSELICDNYPMLLVMSRFGIDLGFGDDTIEQVCERSGVDTYTFLAVVNILISTNKRSVEIDYSRVSLRAVIDYLHNSHSYFLDYRLPSIREKLIASIGQSDDVAIVIANYYDEYVSEVNRHMMYEENTLFSYIRSLIVGEAVAGYSIGVYSRNHDNVEERLSEFKNIIIKYYPAKSSHDLNSTLYDIFSCERDLESHTFIEDFLLVPAIESLERAGDGANN
ncbi:MAG: hemerythrin domain-containing protein [Rikenellaceae bacterium]